MRLLLLALLLTYAPRAQDLGGGAMASNGLVPYLRLDLWRPGASSTLTLQNAPGLTPLGLCVFSTQQTNTSIGSVDGTLLADPAAGFVVSLGWRAGATGWKGACAGCRMAGESSGWSGAAA